MKPEDLVGIWSADHMYGPGAQSDEMFVFKPDGTGRFEFLNFMLCTAYDFEWRIIEDNKLRLNGTRTRQLGDDAKTVVQSEDLLNLTDAPFSISVEDTPSGQIMRVLRVNVMETVSDRYGFVREDLAGMEEADFG